MATEVDTAKIEELLKVFQRYIPREPHPEGLAEELVRLLLAERAASAAREERMREAMIKARSNLTVGFYQQAFFDLDAALAPDVATEEEDKNFKTLKEITQPRFYMTLEQATEIIKHYQHIAREAIRR